MSARRRTDGGDSSVSAGGSGSEEEELVSRGPSSRFSSVVSVSEAGTSRINSFPSSKRSSVSGARHDHSESFDEYDQGQAPILEEEDCDAETPEGGQSLEAWESWRAVFPEFLLDDMARWFEGKAKDCIAAAGDPEAPCIISLKGLERFGEHVMNLPRPAVAHAFGQAKGSSGLVEKGEEPPFLTADSLPDLLELFRAAQDFAERECPTEIWPAKELQSLRTWCVSQQNRRGMVPPDRLYSAFVHLGVDTELVDREQQHIADVAGAVIQQRPGNLTTGAGSGGNAFYEEEVLKILTRCTKDWERQRWRRQLQDEQEARTKAGFSYAEMEELRELYRAFKELDAPQAAGPDERTVQRLTVFLNQCGIQRLARADVEALREIFASTATASAEAPSAAEVDSFGNFACWMNEVFSSSLGGLSRNSIQAKEDKGSELFSHLHGFARAFLSEQARREAQKDTKQNAAVIVSVADADGWPAANIMAVASATSAVTTPTASAATSRRTSSKTSLHGRHTVVSGAARRAGSATSASSRRGISRSKTFSTASGAHSRSHSEANSDEDNVTDATGVLREKGLPPSEAMLSRREIRACSVDLGDAERSAQVRAHLVEEGRSEPSAAASTEPKQRKVKPVAETEVVVSAVIMRLQSLQELEERTAED